MKKVRCASCLCWCTLYCYIGHRQSSSQSTGHRLRVRTPLSIDRAVSALVAREEFWSRQRWAPGPEEDIITPTQHRG